MPTATAPIATVAPDVMQNVYDELKTPFKHGIVVKEVQQAHLVSQQAQIESAKAQLTDAQRDLKRQLGLLASQDVSQSIVDQAQTKVDQLFIGWSLLYNCIPQPFIRHRQLLVGRNQCVIDNRMS